MIQEHVKPQGQVEIVVEYKNGTKEEFLVKNAVLNTGREALASALSNNIGDAFDFYIARMQFGTNGANGGVPKVVNTERNGLFGPVLLSKPVISTIDPNKPSQVIFTTVLTFDEANDNYLSEMALSMNNGDLYSMTTFPGLYKNSEMQITWNWRVSFI